MINGVEGIILTLASKPNQKSMKLEELHEDLLQQIMLSNDANHSQSAWSLFEIYMDYLQGSGQFIDDYTPIEFGTQELHFSAFARDEERGVLNLLMTDYRSAEEVVKVYQKDVADSINLVVQSLDEIIIPIGMPAIVVIAGSFPGLK